MACTHNPATEVHHPFSKAHASQARAIAALLPPLLVLLVLLPLLPEQQALIKAGA